MIWHRVEQNTDAWKRMRLGKPTASEFKRIITPATGKLSSQAHGYMCRLLSELMVGAIASDEYQSPWMERGHEEEDRTIARYELMQEVETEPGGFFTNDAGTIGASPDRVVVGGKIGVEAKSPSPAVQMSYLLDTEVDDSYRPQLQGQLHICEFEQVHIFAQHPEMPETLIKVDRDEEYIAKLAAALDQFVDRLQNARALLEQRYGAFPDLTKPAEIQGGAEFLSDEDARWHVDRIMEGQSL